MNATDKQVSYMEFLARKEGFAGATAAANEYGFPGYASRLTVRQASEVIDWLKNGCSIAHLFTTKAP